jgi:hypothetical protein
MTPERERRPERSGTAVRALRWAFVSRRHGCLTVAQWPNVPLAIFLLATVASRVFHPARAAATFLRVLGVVALVVWAFDEVARGVNPFRRMLGVAVLVATVALLILR